MFKKILKVLLQFITGFAIIFGVVGTALLANYVYSHYNDYVILSLVFFAVTSSSYLVGRVVIK